MTNGPRLSTSRLQPGFADFKAIKSTMNKALHTTEAIEKLPDGRCISYCDYGHPDGIPIFQFHGTPGSRIFGLDSEEVSAAGLRILTPERPGYGKSSPNPDAVAVADWAQDIQILADQLNLDRFHVLGVSGGGPFALSCAALLPQRVITATVVASPAPMITTGFWTGLSVVNRMVFFISRYATVLLPLLSTAMAALMKDRGDASTHQGEAFRQGGIGLRTDLQLITKNWNFLPESIRVPVYWWQGERDNLASPAAGKELAKIIPTCEPHFEAACGHFIHRDPVIAQKILDRLLAAPVFRTQKQADTAQKIVLHR